MPNLFLSMSMNIYFNKNSSFLTDTLLNYNLSSIILLKSYFKCIFIESSLSVIFNILTPY